ncbi:hypothetical protein ABPG72_022670 [Tetrahymena utriculariae]
MSQRQCLSDSFDEEDYMEMVFLKKKESYRLNIRKAKVQQTLCEIRQKKFYASSSCNLIDNTNFNSSIELLSKFNPQNRLTQKQISFLSTVANKQDIIQSILSQHQCSYLFLSDAKEWFQKNIQCFQELEHNKFSNNQLQQIRVYIDLAQAIEETANIQIIHLNDILFLTRMMNVCDIQQKLEIIDIMSALYDSKQIKQNIIQYLIQYINMDKMEISERILGVFIDKLVKFDSILIKKLNQLFFQKMFKRLLHLKCQSLSMKVLKIATILIENSNIYSLFIQSNLQNQNTIFQLLIWHLELKDIFLMKEITKFLYSIINENSECLEIIQCIIQQLIDSQLINKLFDIFTSQSREYQFFINLILKVFSYANHFQIEHFFETQLKYFIMNHLINCLISNQPEFILNVLQFIHQLLFEENEYNQQNYYPRKRLIQSLDIQVYINSLISYSDDKISNQALNISTYL